MPGAPEDERRADRHQLPEHEHREQVAGERDTDRRTRVDERGGYLEPARLSANRLPPNAMTAKIVAKRRESSSHGKRAEPVAEEVGCPDDTVGQRETGREPAAAESRPRRAPCHATADSEHAPNDQHQPRVQDESVTIVLSK